MRKKWMDKIPLFFSDQPEIGFARTLAAAGRKQQSQVFTPYPIAKIMAQWVMNGKTPQSLLDPAFGLGIFFRAYLEQVQDRSIRTVGYEIDENLASLASDLFMNNGYAHSEIHVENYLTADWESRYDGILCNPPYRRFRGLTDRHTYVEIIKQYTGFDLSSASNLYIYFIVKAVSQLSEGGRAAFIIPYEFLNADYGKDVKEYLLSQKVLRKVLVLGKDLRPFENVITTSCILCLERTKTEAQPVIQVCNTLETLADNITSHNESMDAENLGSRQSSQRWIAPKFQPNNTNFANLVPLSTYGKVMRGIATGDNHYFVLSESSRIRVNLDREWVIACLSKASYAPDLQFTEEHINNLVKEDKPVWLLNANGHEDKAEVQNYLKFGSSVGADKRYLTRNRIPWYALEQRLPAPLLATTFSREGIRWIRNLTDIRNLTAFHGFYPNPDTDIDLLHAYLITPIAQQIFSQNQREYGNGLHKFEPNDLNGALVIDLAKLTQKLKDEILEMYTSLLIIKADKTRLQNQIEYLNYVFLTLTKFSS